MTWIVQKPVWATFILLGGVIFVVWLFNHSSTQTAVTPTSHTPEETRLTQDPLPFAVSGIVAASDRAVIAAKTGGVIEHYAVADGSTVTAGAVLVTQATPAADAQYALAIAQGALTAAQQQSAVTNKTTAADIAALEAQTAAKLATLRAGAGDSRVSEATVQLKATLTAQLLSTLTTIDFIDDHRYLFDAPSLKLYDQTVQNLYGTVPDYFSGSLAVGRDAAATHEAIYENLTSGETTDATAMATLGSLLVSEADALGVILRNAESDIFDNKTDTTNETYRTYVSVRSAGSERQAATVAALAALTTAADASAQDSTSQTTAVAVSDLDRALAAAEVGYATAIATAAANVSAANAAVAAATASDGVVRAPFAGVVANVFKKPGEYAQPGQPLLTLIGTGGREMTVHLPADFATQLKVGDAFMVDGTTAGFVTRIAPVSDGKNITAVISLAGDTPQLVGTTLSGTIMLTPTRDLYTVPRAYVHFDAAGSYVLAAGVRYPVAIAYDHDETLLIVAPTVPDTALALSTSDTLTQ